MNLKGSLLTFLLLMSATLGTMWGKGDTVVVPIVVNGGSGDVHFQTTFNIMSLSTTADSATIVGVRDVVESASDLFCPPGISTLPPFDPRTTREGVLPAEGSLVFTSSGESIELFTGWAYVTTDIEHAAEISAEISIINGPPQPCHDENLEIIPRIDVGTRSSEELVTNVKVPGVMPDLEWQAPVTIGTGRETALALVNPGEEEAEVTIRLRDSEGTVVENASSPAEYTLLLGPMERVSTFVWRLAFAPCDFTLPPDVICSGTPPGPPPKPDLFRGTVQIESTVPIAVGGLDVLFPEGKWVGVEVKRRVE